MKVREGKEKKKERREEQSCKFRHLMGPFKCLRQGGLASEVTIKTVDITTAIGNKL